MKNKREKKNLVRNGVDAVCRLCGERSKQKNRRKSTLPEKKKKKKKKRVSFYPFS